MAILGLQLRGQTHAVPFLLIQATVAITVEPLQQTGEIALPLSNHLALRSTHIEPLATAATAAEIADGIQRLASVQALLAVAITLAGREPGGPAAPGRPARVAQIAPPYLAGRGPHLRTPRVDQTAASAVVQQQPAFAAAAFDQPPAVALAAGLVLLDPEAPPQAWLAGQRRNYRGVRLFAQHAVELDVTLGCRTDLRGRRIQ
ncbi:hypothetical protein D9M68_728100 [compost metagenome]